MLRPITGYDNNTKRKRRSKIVVIIKMCDTLTQARGVAGIMVLTSNSRGEIRDVKILVQNLLDELIDCAFICQSLASCRLYATNIKVAAEIKN